MAQACNPSTLGGWGGWITRSTDGDHLGQHGEIPSLLKIQKLAGHGGMHLYSQLLGRLRQKNHLNLGEGGCSEPRWHHCTPDRARLESDMVPPTLCVAYAFILFIMCFKSQLWGSSYLFLPLRDLCTSLPDGEWFETIVMYIWFYLLFQTRGWIQSLLPHLSWKLRLDKL